jgi:CRISPR-associated exonuclease Cas4
METLTGTRVKYYHICHRKLWLFDRDVWMEHTSESVADGELLHSTAYPQRAARGREISLGGSKIDFYDPQTRVVHEMKRSASMPQADVAQLKFYLWLLEQHDISGATGLLEYPKQRRTEEVQLSDEDRAAIPLWEADIARITAPDAPCPPVINKPYCKRCAYYDFCYVEE